MKEPYRKPAGVEDLKSRLLAAKLQGTVIENYFVLEEAHCRGFEEDRSWTLHEWIRDHGRELYHGMNNLRMEIVADDFPLLRKEPA